MTMGLILLNYIFLTFLCYSNLENENKLKKEKELS